MKDSQQKDLNRVEAVLGFMPATTGQAFVLVMDTAQGPMNLEFDDATTKGLLVAVLQAAVACAERRSALPTLADTDPAGGVLLPASDVQVLPVVGAHKRLVIRVGTLDFSVMVSNQKMAQALIWALRD